MTYGKFGKFGKFPWLFSVPIGVLAGSYPKVIGPGFAKYPFGVI